MHILNTRLGNSPGELSAWLIPAKMKECVLCVYLIIPDYIKPCLDGILYLRLLVIYEGIYIILYQRSLSTRKKLTFDGIVICWKTRW